MRRCQGPVMSFNMADYFFQYICLNNKRTATEMNTVLESCIHPCALFVLGVTNIASTLAPPPPYPVHPRDKEHKRLFYSVLHKR